MSQSKIFVLDRGVSQNLCVRTPIFLKELSHIYGNLDYFVNVKICT